MQTSFGIINAGNHNARLGMEPHSPKTKKDTVHFGERTVVGLKPDAFWNYSLGNVISSLEAFRLQIVGMKMLQMDPAKIREHYIQHKERPGFDWKGITQYLTAGPMIFMLVDGPAGTIQKVRDLFGPTQAQNAGADTVRGKYFKDTITAGKKLFGDSVLTNGTHASGSVEEAAAEEKLYFGPQDVFNWQAPQGWPTPKF